MAGRGLDWGFTGFWNLLHRKWRARAREWGSFSNADALAQSSTFLHCVAPQLSGAIYGDDRRVYFWNGCPRHSRLAHAFLAVLAVIAQGQMLVYPWQTFAPRNADALSVLHADDKAVLDLKLAARPDMEIDQRPVNADTHGKKQAV